VEEFSFALFIQQVGSRQAANSLILDAAASNGLFEHHIGCPAIPEMFLLTINRARRIFLLTV
jgi:hypothetical protein